MNYQAKGIHVDYNCWHLKARDWVIQRKLFDLDALHLYDKSRTDSLCTFYTYFGGNPRMPLAIKEYQNRVSFDWVDSNHHGGPWLKKPCPTWVSFHGNGNSQIEWKHDNQSSGIHFAAWDDVVHYRVNGKSADEQKYKEWYLMTHLEEFEVLTERQLIRKWLYDEPLIGDEKL